MENTEIALPNTLTLEVLKGSGIHIGGTKVSKDMSQFVSSKTNSGIALLDINQIVNRVFVAGNYIANCTPDKVLVVGTNPICLNAVNKFSEMTKTKSFTKRFYGGTLTNSILEEYTDAEAIVVSNPLNGRLDNSDRGKSWRDPELHKEARAMYEATAQMIPVIAFVNTDCTLSEVDIAIPSNNRGARAVAMSFYLLTRAVLLYRNELKPEDPLSAALSDFETYVPPEVEDPDETSIREHLK